MQSLHQFHLSYGSSVDLEAQERAGRQEMLATLHCPRLAVVAERCGARAPPPRCSDALRRMRAASSSVSGAGASRGVVRGRWFFMYPPLYGTFPPQPHQQNGPFRRLRWLLCGLAEDFFRRTCRKGGGEEVVQGGHFSWDLVREGRTEVRELWEDGQVRACLRRDLCWHGW
ncbi:hypothetical protein AB1Y20_002353 [Prymnesium parvum]|uniref:Uncharacterized protein n=1 Tax=Prymnesium parvum TaxID=97485 RepID=A0AB34J8A1_PRYPA